MDDKKSSRNKLIKRGIISIVVLFFSLVVLFYVKKVGLMELSQEEIKIFLQEKGALAPLLFILITFLQVTFIPIPSTITVLVGNYLFGFWVSYLYSFIGM